MCGRFTLRTSAARLVEAFQLAGPIELPPRYNIAPTQDVAAVRLAAAGRELAMFRWGLIPSWADDPRIGHRSINARCETVDSKPTFRAAFRRRRCLVLADGYYEWKPAGRLKQPYFIHAADDRPLAFAGLWDRWSRGEQAIESCTILTTDANALLADLHDRMPVVLDPADYSAWLDPAAADVQRLMPLLVPCAKELLTFHAVSAEVNRPSFDRPECVTPAASQRSLPGFGA